MAIKKICIFICILLASNIGLHAQNENETQPIKVSYDSVRNANRVLVDYAIGTDVCGPLMIAGAAYGQAELFGRVNIKHRFFPIVELGYGISNHTNKDTELNYKMSSPYLRIGMDYNFLKTHQQPNRIFGGFRIGYSQYEFDLSGNTYKDPIYHAEIPVDYKGIDAHQLWAELVIGLETQLYKFVHIGWDARYKRRIKEQAPSIGNAAYVPGYGRYGQHCFGGSFKIILVF